MTKQKKRERTRKDRQRNVHLFLSSSPTKHLFPLLPVFTPQKKRDIKYRLLISYHAAGGRASAKGTAEDVSKGEKEEKREGEQIGGARTTPSKWWQQTYFRKHRFLSPISVHISGPRPRPRPHSPPLPPLGSPQCPIQKTNERSMLLHMLSKPAQPEISP